MTKILSGAIVAMSFCLSVGCAHTETRDGKVADGKGAIRLDQKIREACGNATGDAFFAYDSTSLTNSISDRLDALGVCLTTGSLKDRHIDLVGYTDPSGSKEYNKDLGKARADHVASYLVQKGVPAARLHVSSRGEEGASPDPEKWPADRMVDVSLVPASIKSP